MRKLLMAATMLTALGFAGTTTAFADGYNGHGQNNGNNTGDAYGDNDDQGYGNNGYGNNGGQGYGNDGGNRYGQGGEGADERRDRDWEGSWRPWAGYHDHDQILSQWKLERRIERQGYYGIRNLHPSRFGFGWKAFAQDRFGRPVALRINPHNGRVLDVHVLYRHY